VQVLERAEELRRVAEGAGGGRAPGGPGGGEGGGVGGGKRAAAHKLHHLKEEPNSIFVLRDSISPVTMILGETRVIVHIRCVRIFQCTY
jgi:hypothetical protein